MEREKALQKVVIVRTTEELREGVEALASTLRDQGIVVCLNLGDDMQISGGCSQSDADWDEEGVLYLTDDVKRLRIWEKCGIKSAILLHQGNRQEDLQGILYALEQAEEFDREDLDKIYRRLHGLPWRILETERCVVREITVADVDRLYEIYDDPSITAYIDNLYADPEEERTYTQAYIRNMYGFYGYGMWIVAEKHSGRVIGRAGIEPGKEEAELGYVIARPWQELGIASEVCAAILEYGFSELGLELITARVQRENESSKRLLKKLGFQKHSETAESDVIMEKWICKKG